MVGAALDQDVAGGQHGLALFHHGPDFAVEYDGEIGGLGFVHARGFRVVIMGVPAAHLAEGRTHIGVLPDVVGREINDAEDRAVGVVGLDGVLSRIAVSVLRRCCTAGAVVSQSLVEGELGQGFEGLGRDGPSRQMMDLPAALWPVIHAAEAYVP